MLSPVGNRFVGDRSHVHGRGHLRDAAIGEEFGGEFVDFFAKLVEEHGSMRKVIADPRSLFGNASAASQRGQRGRQAIED